MSVQLAASFNHADRLVDAVEALQARGHKCVDAYTPYPDERLSEALACRTGRIAWTAGIATIVGSLIMVAALYYTAQVAYPLDLGGRPSFSLAGAASSTIIVAILWGCVGALAGFLWFAKLPRLHHPIFDVDGFERLSDDRFFLVVETPGADAAETAANELRELGADTVQQVPA